MRKYMRGVRPGQTHYMSMGGIYKADISPYICVVHIGVAATSSAGSLTLVWLARPSSQPDYM